MLQFVFLLNMGRFCFVNKTHYSEQFLISHIYQSLKNLKFAHIKQKKLNKTLIMTLFKYFANEVKFNHFLLIPNRPLRHFHQLERLNKSERKLYFFPHSAVNRFFNIQPFISYPSLTFSLYSVIFYTF